MRINLSSVMVDDQDKALKFYTEVLGFVKKTDTPVGEYRWLTVTSPEGPEGIQLVLEPMGFPPARDYQQALFAVKRLQAVGAQCMPLQCPMNGVSQLTGFRVGKLHDGRIVIVGDHRVTHAGV
jgi:catechol 2,3-dioxygenase-like lactoylglutathione lyase family enzyme